MDSQSLVEVQIEAGERLLRQLDQDGFPLEAAFWAKTEESGLWFLYLVTPLVERTGPAESYRDLHHVLQRIEGISLSLADIKLIGLNHDLSPIVTKVRRPDPSKHILRLGDRELAGTPIVEAFLYPHTVLVKNASTKTKRDDIIYELFRLLSEASGTRSKSTVTLKDGESFTGVPFSIQTSTQGPMVQFVTEGDLAPRVLGIDEIASIRESY